jgi:hypothetical protein
MEEILKIALNKAGRDYNNNDPYLLFEKGSTNVIANYLVNVLKDMGYELCEEQPIEEMAVLTNEQGE